MDIRMYNNPEYLDKQYNDCYFLFINQIGGFIGNKEGTTRLLETRITDIDLTNVDNYARSRNFEKCVSIDNAFNRFVPETVTWFNGFDKDPKKSNMKAAAAKMMQDEIFDRKFAIRLPGRDAIRVSLYRALSRIKML